MTTTDGMKALTERLYGEALRYSTTSQIYQDLMEACSIIDHYAESVKNGDIDAQLFSPDLPVEQVLKIGREFQEQDTWHGAHYDTVRLLCDTIERLNRERNVKDALQFVSHNRIRREAQGECFVSANER